MSLNQGCRNCCENVLRATSVSASGGSFFFVTNSTITPKNGCKYVLCIPCSILPTTAITTVDQVYVVVDGVNIPLQCVLGNSVFTDQIRYFNVDRCGNIVLRLAYGSTPTHFKILNQCLKPSTAYGATAVAAEATAQTASTASVQSTKASSTTTPKA